MSPSATTFAKGIILGVLLAVLAVVLLSASVISIRKENRVKREAGGGDEDPPPTIKFDFGDEGGSGGLQVRTSTRQLWSQHFLFLQKAGINHRKVNGIFFYSPN